MAADLVDRLTDDDIASRLDAATHLAGAEFHLGDASRGRISRRTSSVGGERVRAAVTRFRRSTPSPATCGGCRAVSRRPPRFLRRRWRRHISSQILICWR